MTAKNKTTAASKVKALRVIGPKSGRRRAGRAFGPEKVDIPLNELKPGERKALEADDLLIVSEVEIEIEANGKE